MPNPVSMPRFCRIKCPSWQRLWSSLSPWSISGSCERDKVGIRSRLPGISIADQWAESRGLTEETAEVKLMLFGGDNYHRGVPTHHIHQSHVKEHASRDGEDPAGETVCVLAHGRANHHANVGHEGGQQIVDDGLLH